MDLIVIRNCIFTSSKCFLDIRTNEIYREAGGSFRDYSLSGFLKVSTGEFIEGSEKEWVEKECIELPSYSVAHVRQMYIQKMEEEKQHVITEYQLNDYPKFAIDQKDNLKTQNEYISKCHWYCEDNQCEEEFWKYYDSYTLLIAQKWCERMGIVYDNK